jgi:hypothetical protein
VDAESGLESSLQGTNPVGALRGPDAWPFVEITVVTLACAKASIIPSKLGIWTVSL